MKLISKYALISLLSLSVVAFADDKPKYHLVNNTDFSVTSKLNGELGGLCSTQTLGRDGITPKHDSKDISMFQAGVACIKNAKNCIADIYITDDCSGDKVASVIIDVKSGVKPESVVIHNPAFSLIAHDFYIQLDGGPAAAQ